MISAALPVSSCVTDLRKDGLHGGPGVFPFEGDANKSDEDHDIEEQHTKQTKSRNQKSIHPLGFSFPGPIVVLTWSTLFGPVCRWRGLGRR